MEFIAKPEENKLRKKADRTSQILEILVEETRAEVTELSRKLNVSQVTIRKDLDELVQRGIIKREHGYAVLQSTDDMGTRIAYHYEAKQKIARKASTLVQDGDTIMIENGSCCALLADALTESHKDLTIITNSAFIASYIRGKANFQIILLGGIFQQESQVAVGPMVRQMAANFCVDLFFIGTDGFSVRNGFTNRDQLRAEAVRDMAAQAESVIVLTESRKFNHRGIVPLNLGDHVKTVITDSEIPEEANQALRLRGIEVITVS
jgi:DeoR/GlpR family transcriptional regulator of sugar metabolism